MTFENLLYDYENLKIHEFSKRIKEGEYPFHLLESLHSVKNLPPLLIIALLSHPDCTEEYFMSKAETLFRTSGTVARQAVLRVTTLVASLKIIAHSVYATEATIDSIMEGYDMRIDTFKLIASNPHCNPDFKMAVYNKTGNSDLLPQSAQDIFIF